MKYSKCFVFDINFLEAVGSLFRKCYVAIGGQLFRQITGIYMGSDQSLFFANLSLFYYDWQCINNLKKENATSARKFCRTFRFIDDLGIIKNGNFQKNIQNNCPAELELRKENQLNKNANFSDKRDSFNFNIIRTLYKSNNILNKLFYSARSAGILRICKATVKFQYFIKFSKILIGRIIKQGVLINDMKKVLLKLFNSHEEYFIKFGETNHYILNKSL